METTPASKAGRKVKKSDTMNSEQKPKKVNSELRKQQNRIASRNYREKRKKKLLYLQQLIQDGRTEQQQQTSTSSVSNDGERARSISAEFLASSPSCTSISLPEGNDFDQVSSTGSINGSPALATTSEPYDGQFLATSYPYTGLQYPWTGCVYDSQAHANANANASGWDLPQWLPNTECTTSVEPAIQHNFQYSISQHPHMQHFDQCSTPPLQAHEAIPNGDFYIRDSLASDQRYLPQGHYPQSVNQQQPHGSPNPVYI